MKKGLIPPKPVRKEKKLVKFDDVRYDPYYWLRERENPEVKKYLEAENAYFQQVTSDLNTFENKLFEELKSRLKEEDESVPYKYKSYYYQTKFPRGKEYPVFLRWQVNRKEKETFFDANERAKGKPYYQPGGLKISPDDKTLAFGEDFTGRRLYEIRFKNLETGAFYDEILKNTTGTGAWAGDSKTFFYVVKHPETLRAYRLYKHILGTNPDNDELIY
jgi:oligopeptidase B